MNFASKEIRNDMSLTDIDKDSSHIYSIKNSIFVEENFEKYAKQFFEAAECVIDYLLNNGIPNKNVKELDMWYFAMIYLYRQSLELIIKAKIFQKVNSNNDRKKIIKRVGHNLEKAFNELLALLNLASQNNDDLTQLNKFLSDISQIDSGSDTFRYVSRRNNKPSLVEQISTSLQETKQNMKTAYTILYELPHLNLAKTNQAKFIPKLFIKGKHSLLSSVIGYKNHQGELRSYIISYNEVGDFLYNCIISKNEQSYFLPMCYLYRHAVELELKDLIINSIPYMNLDQATVLKAMNSKKKHSLEGLWNIIKQFDIFKTIKEWSGAPEDDKQMDYTEKYIKSFHDFDCDSTIFRYPCDKNMNPYFLSSQKFDIVNFANCFQELNHFLVSCKDVLSDMNEYLRENTSS